MKQKSSFKNEFNAVALPGLNNTFNLPCILVAVHSAWDHWVQTHGFVGGQPNY